MIKSRRFIAFGLIFSSGFNSSWAQAPATKAVVPAAGGAGRPAAAQPQAQQAQQQKAAPAKSPEELAKLAQRMEVLLATWEQRSAQVKELDAEFTRKDHSTAWQEDTEYKGRALLKSPDRAYLDFQKFDPAEKKHNHYERIICTGKEVFHYQTPSRQIFIFPLSAEERSRALEEGPLPFLFNMKADRAKLRYKMLLRTENEEGAWIEIQPLEKIDQESFSKVYVLLNKEKFLPDRLVLYAPNGKDTQDYKFVTIKMNSGVADANFQGVIPKEGWDVVRNPGQGTAQPAGGATNQPVPRVGQLTPGANRPGGTGQMGGARSTAPVPAASKPAAGGAIRR
jgi:TIGR03009 family protein